MGKLQYINDVFAVWPQTLDELKGILRGVKSMHEKRNFNAEISTQSCYFLALTIYQSPTFFTTGIRSTKIFYKPTNLFSYPLDTAHMPQSIHKGIAIGEITRLICNTTSPTLQQRYSRKFINHFKRRKYLPLIIKKLIHVTMKHLSRTHILSKSLKTKIFTIHYKIQEIPPPLNILLRKRW